MLLTPGSDLFLVRLLMEGWGSRRMQLSRVSYIIIAYGVSFLIGLLVAAAITEHLKSSWSGALKFVTGLNELVWFIPLPFF